MTEGDLSNFRKQLEPKEQKIFDTIFEDETRKKKLAIIKEFQIDKDHLEVVNFCCNFFLPGTLLYEKTGYKLVLVDPLFTFGIKNFDLAVFRAENASLILVECKSSISNIERDVEDTYQAISETLKNKQKLEETLGNVISHIEFALCVPALNVQAVIKEIVEKDKPICVWGFDLWKREMKLVRSPKETSQEILAGRMHRDGNLSSLLFEGVKSKLGAVRSIPILPSSHMCTILIHVTQVLYMEIKEPRRYSEFDFPDIYKIIRREMGTYTTLTDDDRINLTEKILKTGLKKKIFNDLTEDIIELKQKRFQLAGRRANAMMVMTNTEENYVDHNARKLAEKGALNRFKEETGFTNLTAFYDMQKLQK